MQHEEWSDGISLENWKDDEAKAWQGQVKVGDLLFAEIGRDLAKNSGLSFVDYYVLITLADSLVDGLTMSDLASSLAWSRSRTSHQVARMEQRGLVRRNPVHGDGRVLVARITKEGLTILKAAIPAHVASVRRHFLDVLGPDDITALSRIYQTLVDHLSEYSDIPVPSRFSSKDHQF